MRKEAAAILEQLDNNGTQDQREFMQEHISSIFNGGVPEFFNRYQGSITNYARNYTAKRQTYCGAPEALALAHHLNRTIVIIKQQPEAEQERQLQLGHTPKDMLFAYLPNFETRVRNYFSRTNIILIK